MQERVKTSFIPKASLQVEREHHATSNPVALANIVTGALLIIAIIASVGIFLFERYTLQNIDRKQANLDVSREAFEPATIRELSRLNKRIEAGKDLLKSHIALSSLFDDLEQKTLSTLRFDEFSYAETNPGRILLSMTGTAASFNTVALQSQEYSKSSIITEPRFSNVNIDKDGSIRFDFTGEIDVTRLRYTGETSIDTNPATPEGSGTASTTPTP